jgi:hypothetical protein
MATAFPFSLYRKLQFQIRHWSLRLQAGCIEAFSAGNTGFYAIEGGGGVAL